MKTQLDVSLEKFAKKYGKLTDDYWTLRSLDDRGLAAVRRKYGSSVDKKLHQFDYQEIDYAA